VLRFWKKATAPLIGPQARRPLPEGLEKKLRSIPSQVLLCRDVDGHWAEWGAGELRGPEVRQIQDHLADCDRCRKLCAALGAVQASAQKPLPLPAHLRVRLRRVPAPRQRIPWWLGDIRFALAASYLLALCVTFGASAAGKTPNLREGSSDALVRSVTSVGGEVNGRARQALAASGRLGTELQRVAEDWLSFPLEKTLALENTNEEEIPAENLRPSNEERR